MGVAMIETGGDRGHAPARRIYEKAGYTPLPAVRFFKSLCRFVGATPHVGGGTAFRARCGPTAGNPEMLVAASKRGPTLMTRSHDAGPRAHRGRKLEASASPDFDGGDRHCSKSSDPGATGRRIER